MTDFVTVARAGEIAPGEMKAVRAGRRIVAIANVDGEYVAFDDTCSHEEASLSEGELFGETVECPLHGAAFNVFTGAVESFPATSDIDTYEVRVEGDEIKVATEPRSG
ncbi:MAG TPA: non-heme iron oxygenase ferredoxin subunit [Thermomicrobiales bacterium]|nr:non-heme iron oxygenase ferredoxin subunit [Thermomicrobiales bacterium]